MNAELVKKALEKVLNPNVLVNMVSRRVRQLNSGAGGLSRPLVASLVNLGAADIAMPEIIALTRPTGTNRKRPQHWAKNKTGAAGEENGANDFPAQKRTGTYG